ncbi:unnamed protein product [Closterium sp. NIES-54]
MPRKAPCSRGPAPPCSCCRGDPCRSRGPVLLLQRPRRCCLRAPTLPTTGEHCPALTAAANTAATGVTAAPTTPAAPAAAAAPGVARCSSRAVLVSPSRPSSFVSASGSGQVQLQRRPREALLPQQLREWYAQSRGSLSTARCPYVIRMGVRTGQPCGTVGHTGSRYLARLSDAWRTEFGDDAELPDWVELLRQRVDIFAFDYDAIHTAMYALSTSAGEAASLGASEFTAPGAGESALSGATPAAVLHTFTLDSGASRSFFRDSTKLTSLSRPVAVSLADPSGGPVLAHSSTVQPCPAAPSGLLSGLHLPSFSTNLVSGADLQDAWVFAAASWSSPASAPCSCRPLVHETLLWHHRLGHPSLPRLRGMVSRALVSGLPRSLPPIPPGPAPTCVPCVEGRQRAAPHSSSFPPTEAPLQTLHMDVWGPARVRGQGHERYFLLVIDDYSRYTTDFPLRSKGEVIEVLIDWIRGARRQLSESFGSDLPVLRLHSDRGGEFSSDLLRAFCRSEGICQTFTLPASPQQNGIAERRIGMVMDVARTSMIHAAAPHFLWPFAVQYAAHQIKLQPCVSLPKTTPTMQWTGKVGDASAFRVWGSRAFVRDTTADKLSSRAFPCVFLGFPPDAPGWQFYHPTSRRVLSSQDATFDESGPAPSGASQVDPAEPVEVAVDSGAARGADPAGAGTGGAESGGAESGGAETGRAETGRAEPGGVPLRREPLSPQRLREWYSRRCRVAAGGAAGAAGAGATGGAGAAGGGAGPPPVPSQSQLQPASPLPGPSPYSGPTRGLTERREPESRPVSPASRSTSPVRSVRAGRVSRPCLPPVPCTHSMTLHPSTAPQRVPLPSPPASSLPDGPDPESDSLRAASPTVTRFLTTAVTSSAASALVAELVDFAAACRLDYAASLVAESASASVCPPSVGGECALGTDILEDRQEDLECFAAASPHLVSMLLAPEGDPDALDIPTPRSYGEAIEGPYSSQWQAAMDAEMASWKSTSTYVDEVPPPGANIVSGMWIFRVKRPPGCPPAFKARYIARGFSQRQGVDFFQTFSPTPKMTTLRVLLYVAAQRDYELHSLDFSTAFLQGSLHEEIWLRRPPGFTGSFPTGTQWSLRRPVYGLRQAPHDLVFATADTEALAHVKSELQKRHTRTDLGELTSYLGLRITRDRAQRTISLTQSHMVQQVLQHFGFTYSSPQSTRLPTGHSLSAPPSDESIEPSGPYLELVGCLMYMMTCTRPDLAYPLSLLARYVAPGWHRKVHWDAAKRVLRYLCSTSGMGLVLGGRARVVLTGHADASWVDDLATQRSSQGYTFNLGSGSELRWLTYLLTDLGEAPRSPPVLYVDNKAMLALCQEHRLEHRTKHIALRYFLARELQQRGQLRLAYVASQANTADVFTKALQPCDHQRFCTVLGLVPTVPHKTTDMAVPNSSHKNQQCIRVMRELRR